MSVPSLPANFQDMSTYCNAKTVRKKKGAEKAEKTYAYFIKQRTENNKNNVKISNLPTKDADGR